MKTRRMQQQLQRLTAVLALQGRVVVVVALLVILAQQPKHQLAKKQQTKQLQGLGLC